MIDIIRAVKDDNLFLQYLAGDSDNLDTWKNWLAFLRVLYGLKIPKGDNDIIQKCTGRNPDSFPSEGFSEALVLCGRRSGKSKVIALVGAFEAVLSGKEKHLSKGELGMVAIISPTRNQSRIIFNYMKDIFTSAPLLANEVKEEKGREGFLLKNNVEISILTGSPASVRGFSIFAAIIDEVASFHWSEEARVRSDTELLRALRPSLSSTGGRLIAVGSPYAAQGFSYNTFRKHFANNESKILVWSGPSLFMNPTLPEKVVKRALDEDYTAASVEYCIQPGLFREDVDTFISRSTLEALVVPGRKELPPRSGLSYGAFVDMSGGRHDDAALAIAHMDMENRVLVLDVLERYKAPHSPYVVVSEMVSTLRRYGISKCYGDQYSAEWSRLSFQSMGIKYERASTSVFNEGTSSKNKVGKSRSMLYLELLPRLNSGEIELLDFEPLISQLSSLQRRTRAGARDSIDHPPGGHDDCANVLAGVNNVVSQRPRMAGAMNLDSPSTGNAVIQRICRQAERSKSLMDYENERCSRKEDHNETLKQFMYKVGRYSPSYHNFF